MTQDRISGIITFWSGKGFGFAKRTGSEGDDVFLHATQLPSECDSLTIGAKVTFGLALQKDGRTMGVDVEVVQ